VYEFYVEVKADPAVLGKISSIFAGQKAEILGVHLQLSNDKRKGYAIFYIEMSKATADAAELVDLLNHEGFVIEATAASRSRVFFETNMFPPTSGGHYRVFVMGSESWINLVKSFKQRFGTSADSILYSQGVSAGIAMAEGIQSRIGLGEIEAAPKIANLKALFKSTGLGLLEISQGNDSFGLTINESMAAKREIVDNFLVGTVAGAMSKLFSKEYVVSDLKHNVKRGGQITFNLLVKN
jgi:hypothetical protein